jgi:hypothetical protein
MKAFESHLTSCGLTTVPKALRTALGAQYGGRLVWALLPDGSLLAQLKHAYPPQRSPRLEPTAATLASGVDLVDGV